MITGDASHRLLPHLAHVEARKRAPPRHVPAIDRINVVLCGPRARRALLWTHERLQSRAKRREIALLYVRSGPGSVGNASTFGPGTALPPFPGMDALLARRLALALRLVLSRCSHLGHFASAFLTRSRSYGPRGSTFAPSWWCAEVRGPCSPCSKAASASWQKSSSDLDTLRARPRRGINRG